MAFPIIQVEPKDGLVIGGLVRGPRLHMLVLLYQGDDQCITVRVQIRILPAGVKNLPLRGVYMLVGQIFIRVISHFLLVDMPGNKHVRPHSIISRNGHRCAVLIHVLLDQQYALRRGKPIRYLAGRMRLSHRWLYNNQHEQKQDNRCLGRNGQFSFQG